MGRGGKNRHAYLVPSLSTPSQSIPVQDPLLIGNSSRNNYNNSITIKPLTTPLSRSPAIQKRTTKKTQKKVINQIKKVGLDLFELNDEKSKGVNNLEGENQQVGTSNNTTSGSGEFGIVKRSAALQASIAAVLAISEKNQMKAQFGLSKEENLSAAEKLKREMKEVEMNDQEVEVEEDEDELIITTTADEEVTMKGVQDVSDSAPEEMVVRWLNTTSQDNSSPSNPNQSLTQYPTISFQPLAQSSSNLISSSAADSMELDEAHLNSPEARATSPTITSSPATFFTSPFQTSSPATSLFSPSFIPPAFAAPEVVPSFEPTYTSNSPDVTPRASSPIPTVKPLRSAAAITRGRIRKPKKVKKRQAAKLFDYLSDESEDWDEPVVETIKRPRSGRALPGDAAPFTAGPGEKAPILVDPEMILPSTRAHAVKLNPTSYQQALLERAMTENIIVVLETGSGKTLISVLLIEWMHTVIEPARILAGEKKRMQFVLTNSVPLVHQQANVLSHNSSLRVGKLFGALNVNLSNKEEWEWSFENFDCLVLTAQLLLDSLAHGFISMTEIALIVFDEAHHAKSNHPFASILRDFYHRTEIEFRPKILGLTASPLDSNEGIADAKRLQDLFNAKLVTASVETRPALREMVSRPTILAVSYKPPPSYPNTQLNLNIHKKYLGSKSAIAKVQGAQDEDQSSEEVVFSKCSRAASIALNDLGPAASDLVWHLALVKSEEKLISELADPDALEPYVPDDTDLDPEFNLIHPNGKDDIEMDSTKEVIEKENQRSTFRLPEWLMEVKKHKMDPPKEETISPKLQALVRLLTACETAHDDFCGIVFVNRRLDALLITQLLKQFAKSNPALSWLKVKCVTGHGASGSNSLGPKMNWGDQASVLTAFGSGQCNLLIATSVVEEGLDVQPCNFVARFDLPSTHVSYTQSRGRARRAGSHYILFIEEGNHSARRKLAQIHQYDEEMDQLLDHVEQSYDGNADYGDDDEANDNYLIEPQSGALLTPHFSVSLLYRYCQSLPKSDVFNINKPIFDIQERTKDSFICVVTLPPSSRVRTFTSNLCLSAKEAKREAAFGTCKLLRHYEALDPHFLPVRMLAAATEEVVRDENGKAIGSKKRQLGYEKKICNSFHVHTPFTDQSELFGTFLRFSGSRGEMLLREEVYAPMILLTRNPLPKTPNLKLFIDGQPISLIAEPLASAFSVSREQRAVLQAYTLQVFSSTLNRLFDVDENEVLYFIAPLRNDRTGDEVIDISTLDWKAMVAAAVVKETKLKMENLDGLDDSVIVDEGKNECRYFFKTLHRELTPSSKLPPGRQSDAGFYNVLDYYMSFNEPLFHKFHVDMNQPLFEVTRMPKVVSYLTATPRNNSSVSPKKLLSRVPRYALPQLCSKHSIPSSHFRTQLMLPSILTELDQLLLVQEVNAKYFGKKLNVDLVRMSLNTPSAGLEDDYNRLELLGDSFLKYVTSVYCFVALDRTAHEGDLHYTRIVMINNATLFKAGVELNLPQYLVSKPFTSRLFIPPNFKLLKGQPPPHLAIIGDKTIADVIEALIGAGFETGNSKGGLSEGFNLALQVCIALKVDLKGISNWNDMTKVYGPIGTVIPVAEYPTQLEEKLQRRFVHASLLTEALTHPSKLDAAASFQRLEWLGDSVLDFCVIRYSWNKYGGILPPGHLTELKGSMVSNETLAALAVELDLDKFLAHDNALLSKNLEVYRSKLTIAKTKELKEASEEGREIRPYWLLLDAPKAISDIIESLFGAVLVDSNFDPMAPQLTFDHLLVPFYDQWISPTKLKIDAIRILLELAQAAGCNDISHLSTTIEGSIKENGEVIPKSVRTSVICHEVVLATVQTINPKTAKRMVSADALVYLEQNPAFFIRICDCENKRAIAKEEAEEELERRRNEGLESDISSSEDEDEDDEDDEELGGYEGVGKGKKDDKMVE